MEVYLESRGPPPSEPFELQFAPEQSDETHDPQREADQDCRSVASLATASKTPEKAHSSRQISSISSSYIEDNPHKSADSFADLPSDLRAKAQMIGNIETLGDAWHFFNYMGSQSLFAEQDTLDDVPSTSSSDQRLRNLKDGIITLENASKSIKSMEIVSRVKKRVYLAQVAGKYMEETAARKAEPKKRREKTLHRLSVKDRYADLLFAETIANNGKQLSKEEGNQLLKGESGSREKAKEKLEYWMSLGEPLAMMAQRYGIGIILLLPKKLTDKDLHLLPRHRIKTFLGYIDYLHPRLREDISELSSLLPDIVKNGLPLKRIVLETYPSDQLSELYNRPLKELFQFCTGKDSLRVVQDPEDIPYDPCSPMFTITSRDILSILGKYPPLQRNKAPLRQLHCRALTVPYSTVSPPVSRSCGSLLYAASSLITIADTQPPQPPLAASALPSFDDKSSPVATATCGIYGGLFDNCMMLEDVPPTLTETRG
ncbi:hypothetical protein V501_00950 [Pseudogymnoascus sp. VKM F-4519 (FW-2642)]|nr:hypothetical protein V501_00950 [Pseudogymnoascus sp. VKM F-4519 (FW-2642)]